MVDVATVHVSYTITDVCCVHVLHVHEGTHVMHTRTVHIDGTFYNHVSIL